MPDPNIPVFDYSGAKFDTRDDILACFREIAVKGGFNNPKLACNVYLTVDEYIKAVSHYCSLGSEGVYCVGRYKMHLFIKPNA